MAAVIPISERSAKSKVSPKFARSPYFCIIDKVSDTFSIVENKLLDTPVQLGPELLKWLMREYSVDTLIAFELGLKIQKLTNKHQLQLIILNEKQKTLKEIIYVIGINHSML